MSAEPISYNYQQSITIDYGKKKNRYFYDALLPEIAEGNLTERNRTVLELKENEVSVIIYAADINSLRSAFNTIARACKLAETVHNLTTR